MEWAIRTEHLTKIYHNRLVAVNDMCLEVPRGTVFGLLGPNGAGKTTTFRLLLGLQRATAGRAEVLGLRCGPNAVEVRRQIGYLPTHPQFPGHLRPIEYLDLLGQLCRLPHEVRQPRVVSLLRAVGMLGTTDRPIGTLSTGETTRLGIAASLVADPPLLLWDEPTAGLDPAARRFTLDLIRELGRHRTVVVSTHILSDIDQICDHLGVMHQGRMQSCSARLLHGRRGHAREWREPNAPGAVGARESDDAWNLRCFVRSSERPARNMPAVVPVRIAERAVGVLPGGPAIPLRRPSPSGSSRSSRRSAASACGPSRG